MILQIGSKGALVRSFQQKIASYDPTPMTALPFIDGAFGPRTLAAWQQFQLNVMTRRIAYPYVSEADQKALGVTAPTTFASATQKLGPTPPTVTVAQVPPPVVAETPGPVGSAVSPIPKPALYALAILGFGMLFMKSGRRR